MNINTLNMRALVEVAVSLFLIGSSSAVPLGNLGYGVTAKESASGAGYILFSPTDLSGRLTIYSGQATQFVAVYHQDGSWYYYNNEVAAAFTPVASDILVAAVDYSADTATLLSGQNAAVHGIRVGYAGGDINVIANQYNGVSNPGEFGITGTYLNLNDQLPPVVTSFSDGVFSMDYFTQTGKVYFTQSSTDLMTWKFLPDLIEPGTNGYLSLGLSSNSSKLFLRNVSYVSDSQNPEVEDFDNDGYTNFQEVNELGTNPLEVSNTDGDSLPDEWEMYHQGDLSLSDDSNTDGDWLTVLEEYQLGLSPVIDDDSDNDGWLDFEAAKILNMNLSDQYSSPEDVFPWADEDGDGISNASEVAAGTNPLDAADPVTFSYVPVVDLNASGLNAGAVLSWGNNGSLGGMFYAESQPPVATTQAGLPCVQFVAGAQDWLRGPLQPVQVTGAGSRTVVAWVYNPDVSSSQSDVLVSWGGVASGSAERSLFSARLGSGISQGAFKLSGNGTGDQAWGNNVSLSQGQWSFVVFRYNLANGSLMALQDFQVGVNEIACSMDTGVFSSTGMPQKIIIGGDNDSSGATSSQATSLCVGRLYVYDMALPVDEILTLYNNDRVFYGKSALLDSDSDGVPDVMEISLGTKANLGDSDGDGFSDLTEINGGTDPNDFFNGRAHYVRVVSGDLQFVTQGEEVADALVFQVLDASGKKISGAPVTVTVPTSGGKVRMDGTGTPLTTNLQLSADANGEVKVRFKSNE